MSTPIWTMPPAGIRLGATISYTAAGKTKSMGVNPLFDAPQVVAGGLTDAIAAARQLSTTRANQAIGVFQGTGGFALLDLTSGNGFKPATMPTSLPKNGSSVTFEKVNDDFFKTLAAVVGKKTQVVFGDAATTGTLTVAQQLAS